MNKRIGMWVFLGMVCLAVPAFAEGGSDSSKLDQVLRNQQEILQKLDELRAELAVVKVRATNG